MGGDNFLNFPTEVELDKWGAGLFKSKFLDKSIIFGPVNPSTITWSKPVDIVNTMCTKSLMVFDIQGQLLPNKSVEKYSDSTNCEKLTQIYKEKEIKEIITNTTMDKDYAKHEKRAPGNPNPTQHVQKVPKPQRITSPSLFAPQFPQKAHGRDFILKLEDHNTHNFGRVQKHSQRSKK